MIPEPVMIVRLFENKIEEPLGHWFTCVAMLDNQIIGTCDITQWKHPIPAITSLHVQPEFRRRGCASAMIAACVAKCREAGKLALQINVSMKNENAMRLYRWLGFKPALMDDSGGMYLAMQLDGGRL